MKLTQAVAWGLVLGGADAQFRALRRDSGVCSTEIVQTVTKTYTITSSEEVVVPCNTAGHASEPVTTAEEAKPTAEKPTAGGDEGAPEESSSSPASSPASEELPTYKDEPDAHPSELPFETLIPSDYFPDMTLTDSPATSTSSPSASSPDSSDVESSTELGSLPEPSHSDSGDCEGEDDCPSVTEPITSGSMTESVTSEYESTMTPPSETTSLVSTVTAPSEEETPIPNSPSTPEPSPVESNPPGGDDDETSSSEEPQPTSECTTTTGTDASSEEPSATSTCTTSTESEATSEEAEPTSTCTTSTDSEASSEEPAPTSTCTTSTDSGASSEEPLPTSTCTTSTDSEPSPQEPSATSTCTTSTAEEAEPTSTCTTSTDSEPTTASPAAEEPETTTSEAVEEPEATSSESESPATSTVEEEEPEATPTTIVRNYPADAVDKLQDGSMDKLKDHLKRNPSSSCTLENAAVRREWSDLSIPERKDYLKAVQCLQNKPAKTPANVAAGAKSRFDDFVVTHIQQTNTIHNTANFLSWHRYFTWTYETALRDECGYKGFQPYWNWARYTSDPANSPIFNGNATSFGGNSVNGGCAATGPFEKLDVNLGPGNSLRYNPRCLKRDVSTYWAQQCTADKTMSVINEKTISNFQDHMQFSNSIHAGGHFTMGGDPGGDVFASPGDPVFYLHHAMIDRVWWIWQLQDLESRLTAVGGRVGGGSNRQGSLTDGVNLGLMGESVALGELLNTMGGKGGEFCYIYV